MMDVRRKEDRLVGVRREQRVRIGRSGNNKSSVVKRSKKADGKRFIIKREAESMQMEMASDELAS